MNEQCAGCPWLDEQKQQCRRTPPRFCSVDEADQARPAPEIVPPADRRDKPPARIPRAA